MSEQRERNFAQIEEAMKRVAKLKRDLLDLDDTGIELNSPEREYLRGRLNERVAVLRELLHECKPT